MKSMQVVLSRRFDLPHKSLFRFMMAATAMLVLFGVINSDSLDEMIGYLIVLLASVLPTVVWFRAGANGIPVMSVLSVLYFIYYGIPILRKSATLLQFYPSEILSAAATVTSFLAVATISSALVKSARARRSSLQISDFNSELDLDKMIYLGFALGLFYFIASYSGWLSWLGPFFGLFRSISLTTTTLACFVLGHSRGKGTLQGPKWVAGVSLMFIIVLLSWMSLFLVGGMIFCLAAVLGYVITSKRLPLAFISAASVAIIVLHAGKDDMRYKYWGEDQSYHTAEISVTDAPEMMMEWVEGGLSRIFSGKYYDSAIDRASLLHLLLRVQRLTPDYVPFLGGASYAVLPDMLVPRFLDPDKIASQAAMNMLNVRFGFQTSEGTQKTAIGWGLIAEAYANFGHVGVIAVAIVLGLLAGALESWSAGARLISMPGVVTVAILMQLINVEADAAGLATSTFQSVLVVLMYVWISWTLGKQERPLSPESGTREEMKTGRRI
jgi:hypothetical protein